MKKWKNHPADTITLHRCTINDNHDLWFLRYRVQQTDFFVTLGHFLSFYPTNNSKNQNSEKLKKCLEIPSFYTSGSNNHMQVWQVMDIRYSRWWIWFLFFILGYFLPFFTPSVPKIKIWKKNENIRRYHHFTHLHRCAKNYDHMMYCSWDMVRNGQTNR